MPSALVHENHVIAFYLDDGLPSQIICDGQTLLIGAHVGAFSNGYSILPATYTDTPPDPLSYSTGQTYVVTNGAVEVTRTWAEASPKPVSLTFLQFIALFTQVEQAAIVASTDVQVRLFLLMAAGASAITLSDPKTEAGVNYLVSQGLLVPQRAAQILANAPTTS